MPLNHRRFCVFAVVTVLVSFVNSCKPRRSSSNLRASATSNDLCAFNFAKAVVSPVGHATGSRFQFVSSFDKDRFALAEKLVNKHNLKSDAGPLKVALGRYQPEKGVQRDFFIGYGNYELLIDLDPLDQEQNKGIKDRLLIRIPKLKILNFFFVRDYLISFVSGGWDQDASHKEVNNFVPTDYYANIKDGVTKNTQYLSAYDEYLKRLASRSTLMTEAGSLVLSYPGGFESFRPPLGFFEQNKNTKSQLSDHYFKNQVAHLKPESGDAGDLLYGTDNGIKHSRVTSASPEFGMEGRKVSTLATDSFMSLRAQQMQNVPWTENSGYFSSQYWRSTAHLLVGSSSTGPKGNILKIDAMAPDLIFIKDENQFLGAPVSEIKKGVTPFFFNIATFVPPSTGPNSEVVIDQIAVSKTTPNFLLPEYVAAALSTGQIYIFRNVSKESNRDLRKVFTPHYTIHKVVNFPDPRQIVGLFLEGEIQDQIKLSFQTSKSDQFASYAVNMDQLMGPVLVANSGDLVPSNGTPFWKTTAAGKGAGADGKAIYAVQFSPTCDGFVSGHSNGLLQTWTGRKVQEVLVGTSKVAAVYESPFSTFFKDRVSTIQFNGTKDKPFTLVSSMDGQIGLYNGNDLESIRVDQPASIFKEPKGILTATLTKKEDAIVYGAVGEKMKVVPLDTSKPDKKDWISRLSKSYDQSKMTNCTAVIPRNNPAHIGDAAVFFSSYCAPAEGTSESTGYRVDYLRSENSAEFGVGREVIGPNLPGSGLQNNPVFDLATDGFSVYTYSAHRDGSIYRDFTMPEITGTSESNKLALRCGSDVRFEKIAQPHGDAISAIRFMTLSSYITDWQVNGDRLTPTAAVDGVVTASFDGRLVISQSSPLACNGKNEVRDFLRLPKVFKFPKNVDPLTSLSLSPVKSAQSYAVTGSMSGNLYLWHLGEDLLIE